MERQRAKSPFSHLSEEQDLVSESYLPCDTATLLAHWIRMSTFYLDPQFLSHPYYLTQGQIKIMCI